MTDIGCKPRGEAGSLKWTDVKATQHLGLAEKVCHPSIKLGQSIFMECQQEKDVMLDPDQSAVAGLRIMEAY